MSNKPTIDLGAIGADYNPPRKQGSGSSSAPKNKKPARGFTFYKLHSLQSDGARPNYRITKFDEDLNVESSYMMNYMPSSNGGYYDCQCPASKFDCRHKAIQKEIEMADKVDSEQYFCFETRVFKNAEEIR